MLALVVEAILSGKEVELLWHIDSNLNVVRGCAGAYPRCLASD